MAYEWRGCRFDFTLRSGAERQSSAVMHNLGTTRPVLKHGPRSSTCVRVIGCTKPTGEMKVIVLGGSMPGLAA